MIHSVRAAGRSRKTEQITGFLQGRLAETLSVVVLTDWRYRKADKDAFKRKGEETSREPK